MSTLLSWLYQFATFVIYYDYLLLESFSHQRYLMVFHWSLTDSKSRKVPRTLLSVLAVLDNVVVWMVSTPLIISMSSCPFIKYFCDSTKITNLDCYNCHLNVPYFFRFPSKVSVLILLFTFLQFYFEVSRDTKIHNFASSLYLFIIIIIIRWSFIGLWVTASLLKSPGLLSEFWPISIMK